MRQLEWGRTDVTLASSSSISSAQACLALNDAMRGARRAPARQFIDALDMPEAIDDWTDR